MDKLINKSGLQTALEPIVRLIDKKAERPDWNENDPSSSDYIENRPFYASTERKTETIISQMTVEIGDEGYVPLVGGGGDMQ